MALDKFVIAPLSTGLQTDVKPFLIPDDAFSLLRNAYVFRGRVRKRFGSMLMNGSATAGNPLRSRLRIKIATVLGDGTKTGNAPGVKWKVGQMFSIGTETFNVITAGATQAMKRSVGATACTFSTTDGAYNFAGVTPGADIYFYPAEPVMGIVVFQKDPINDEATYAFDTQFAYEYKTTGWDRLGTALWAGQDYNFFWGATYRGVDDSQNLLFVTNNAQYNSVTHTDGIKYFDGTTWTDLVPKTNTEATPNTVLSARMVIPFQNRLLLLSTVESIKEGEVFVTKKFYNRIRWSQNGNPTEATAFDDTKASRGGYLDATTKEAIVSAAVIKNRLIIFFENSTYEFIYTGNEADPFRFQQMNSELGVESTFSTVLFDKAILGAGNVGVHACNGVSVERIDEKIPNFIFDIANTDNGVERVYGIRDYQSEMVYWTLPVIPNPTKYPNKVLVYNYLTGSWALNDDSITAFGYWQNQQGLTWADMTMTWQECEDTWNSGILQGLYRNILAGNQQGFMFQVAPDISRNAPSLHITDITYVGPTATLTIVDHNLTVDDYILVESCIGIVGINGMVYKVDSVVSGNTITVIQHAPPDTPNVTIPFSGSYLGGGTVARVSRMAIITKDYNFYLKNGMNVSIPTIEFYVGKTEHGEFTVDVDTSSANISLLDDGILNGSLLGTNVIETRPMTLTPLEMSQERFWRRFYPAVIGEFVRLTLFLEDYQMIQPKISLSPFELNVLTFYASPITR